jgi:glycosyltransferase involved in cell wall biosynthesis
MPVYNAEPYLAESIRSILDQTHTNLEFLIFNDGSTDKSLAIINKYASVDNRIKVFNSEENKGYLVHLNEGLKIAKGEFIARMDNDDISVATRFEKQIAILSHSETDIVGSNVIFFRNKKSIYGKKSKQALFHQEAVIQMIFSSPVFHPTVMFKRILVDNGDYYYNDKFYPAEDYELWSRLLLRYSFRNIREPLVYYRKSPGQLSNQRKTVQQNLAFEARYNYVSKLCRMEFTKEEKSIFKDLFYDSYRQFTDDEIDTLFCVFHKIINGLANSEASRLFCKYLLRQLSYLSNKKNKLYNLYFKHGFGQYYNGTLVNKFNAGVRQLLK